jgi:flagellar M-ring protein FliF
VTAAVLVDNIAGAPDKAGAPTKRALTPAELESIRTLVQQAIGFDAARGDVVSVVNAPFVPVAEPTPQPTVWWEHPKFDQYLRTVLGGLAVLLVIWVLLRPSMNRLVGRKAPQPPQPLVAAVVDDAGQDASMPQPQQEQALPPPDAPPTAAEMFQSNLSSARQAVQSDPKHVAQVIRTMVTSNG